MVDRPSIVPIISCDEAAQTRLLDLNTAHQKETSYLSPAAWDRLVGTAFAAVATPGTDAFLIACDETADYDSPNFLWFQGHCDRFVYVDRVVVGAAARGQGIARAFYEHLTALAVAAGHDRIVCEVNTDPPNPVSDAFHDALGFTEVGRATLPDRGKSVRYLQRLL